MHQKEGFLTKLHLFIHPDHVICFPNDVSVTTEFYLHQIFYSMYNFKLAVTAMHILLDALSSLRINLILQSQRNLKGKSVVVAILPPCMEVSYCTSGFFCS